MNEYTPWKFIICLPVMLVLMGVHVLCSAFEMLDRNLLEPWAEWLEDWLSD